ncbi:hypothetical protein C7534_122111 [Pseudomonas sp. OV226]|nr:hypothetical protein C7534_122111 [Pseudomonas sp. OV226]
MQKNRGITRRDLPVNEGMQYLLSDYCGLR